TYRKNREPGATPYRASASSDAGPSGLGPKTGSAPSPTTRTRSPGSLNHANRSRRAASETVTTRSAQRTAACSFNAHATRPARVGNTNSGRARASVSCNVTTTLGTPQTGKKLYDAGK